MCSEGTSVDKVCVARIAASFELLIKFPAESSNRQRERDGQRTCEYTNGSLPAIFGLIVLTQMPQADALRERAA